MGKTCKNCDNTKCVDYGADSKACSKWFGKAGCSICTYNLGTVCQTSLKDSTLNGCEPFAPIGFRCDLCIYKNECKNQCEELGIEHI